MPGAAPPARGGVQPDGEGLEHGPAQGVHPSREPMAHARREGEVLAQAPVVVEGREEAKIGTEVIFPPPAPLALPAGRPRLDGHQVAGCEGLALPVQNFAFLGEVIAETGILPCGVAAFGGNSLGEAVAEGDHLA